MKLETNSKSCVADAFSKVTGIPVERLFAAMNTDGREEGIPTQKIVDVLLRNGFAITPIEKVPMRQHPLTGVVDFVYPIHQQANRWKYWLSNSDGVLYGMTMAGLPHALPWFGSTVGLGEEDSDQFNPYLLWKVTKIDATG